MNRNVGIYYDHSNHVAVTQAIFRIHFNWVMFQTLYCKVEQKQKRKDIKNFDKKKRKKQENKIQKNCTLIDLWSEITDINKRAIPTAMNKKLIYREKMVQDEGGEWN